jgi:hypothetical protein
VAPSDLSERLALQWGIEENAIPVCSKHKVDRFVTQPANAVEKQDTRLAQAHNRFWRRRLTFATGGGIR